VAHSPAFKWGVPAAGLILYMTGLWLMSRAGLTPALFGLAVSLLAGFLVIRLDRYAALMRVICSRYRSIRRERPDLDDTMALYLTARWRYPEWAHDRLVELVSGKDIEALILLIAIRENGVNPISDWDLYRSLKEKAARIAGSEERNRDRR
jgi:hypothetical protein